MTEQILFDRLRYMDRLTEAGIPAPQARAHADALYTALREMLTRLRTDAALREDLGLPS